MAIMKKSSYAESEQSKYVDVKELKEQEIQV